MKRSALLWLVLCAAACFLLGFFSHKLIMKDSDGAPPSFLELMIEERDLSETQVQKIRELLDEEDRMIRELLDGEEGKEINHRIGEIRKTISDKIEKVLEAG